MMRNVPYLLVLLGIASPPAFASPFDRESVCITLASLEGSVGSFAQIAEVLDVGSGKPVRLVTTIEEIDQGRIVADLLTENGFRPDRANVALVAHLNPAVQDVARLSIGDRIFVPVLETYDGNEWNAFVPAEPIDGFAVEARVAAQVASSAQQQVAFANEQIRTIALGREGTQFQAVSQILTTELLPTSDQLTGWSSYDEFLGPYDQRIVQVGHTNVFVEELRAVLDRSSGVTEQISAGRMPASEGAVTLAALPAPEVRNIWRYEAGRTSVTLNIFDQDGKPLEGLQVWYTSLAMQQFNCGRQHARHFSSPSHAAQHLLGKAAFVFWVEDPRTNKSSKHFNIDFRQFGASYVRDIYVEWNDD